MCLEMKGQYHSDEFYGFLSTIRCLHEQKPSFSGDAAAKNCILPGTLNV